MKNKNVIEVSNLKKAFKEKQVLNIDTFTLEKGEKIVIYGKNGCGKSTFLKILKGLLSQDSGSVKVNSKDIILMLSGAKGFYGYLSSFDNIKYFLGLNNVNLKDENDNFLRLSKDFEFEEYHDIPFDKLSFGNKQKSLLIAGFISKSDVLLVDEPSTGLDKSSRKVIENELLNYNGSLVVVTHDLELIENLDFDVIPMENGKFTNRLSALELSKLYSNKVKYLFKTEEDISQLSKYKEAGYDVVHDKSICNRIFKDYTVLEFKVVEEWKTL